MERKRSAQELKYYQHHLGDYLRDTAHLSLIEDAIYRRLLDQYYIRERPLPPDVDHCAKLARAVDERQAVEYVLTSFFELQPDGWHQYRADLEIEALKEKSGKARESAFARWNAKREQCDGNADAMRTQCDGNATHNPLPNKNPLTPRKRGKPAKTAMPEGFALTDDLAAYVAAKLPDCNAHALFEQFCGQAKAKAWEYADWEQAFQTYVRNVMPTSGHWAAGQYPKGGNGVVRWR